MTRDRLKSKTIEVQRQVLDTPCWEWQMYRDEKGYPIIAIGGRAHKAHRVAYMLFRKRPIPNGLQLDHLCQNECCINPDHLEPVTHGVNCSRAMNARKTHCKNGHPFNEANTYMKPSGGRQCKICQSESVRRTYLLNLESRQQWSKDYYAKHREKKLEREKLRYREKLAAGWRPRQKSTCN